MINDFSELSLDVSKCESIYWRPTKCCSVANQRHYYLTDSILKWERRPWQLRSKSSARVMPRSQNSISPTFLFGVHWGSGLGPITQRQIALLRFWVLVKLEGQRMILKDGLIPFLSYLVDTSWTDNGYVHCSQKFLNFGNRAKFLKMFGLSYYS